eukprot:2600990-Pleurochrysis_carterae.AAC.1
MKWGRGCVCKGILSAKKRRQGKAVDGTGLVKRGLTDGRTKHQCGRAWFSDEVKEFKSAVCVCALAPARARAYVCSYVLWVDECAC